jgi:hypothetical protein
MQALGTPLAKYEQTETKAPVHIMVTHRCKKLG